MPFETSQLLFLLAGALLTKWFPGLLNLLRIPTPAPTPPGPTPTPTVPDTTTPLLDFIRELVLMLRNGTFPVVPAPTSATPTAVNVPFVVSVSPSPAPANTSS